MQSLSETLPQLLRPIKMRLVLQNDAPFNNVHMRFCYSGKILM